MTLRQIMARHALAVCLLGAAAPIPALAQPADLPIAPATTTVYPPGVAVLKTPTGAVYTDKSGHTLYGMDLRTLIRWSSDPAKYCQADCLRDWEPLFAPKDAKANIQFPRGFGENRAAPGRPPGTPPPGFVSPQAAPDWAIIDGASGLQWVYKGWNMVFIRKGSKKGSSAFDGYEQRTWNTLKFVPPVPDLVAPATVTPKFVDGSYALANKDGRLLFSGTCVKDCSIWTPLPSAMASRGVGEWAVSNAGERPQWLYRGKPVFYSAGDDASVPAGAEVLRP